MTGKRVLVVEDDRWIAKVLEQIILAAAPDSAIEHCTDVPAARRLFDQQPPDLVICDWNLPGIPGIDFVQYVRQRAPHLPVVVVTGRANRDSVVTARARGATAFIAKPFEVDQVLERLRPYLTSTPSDATESDEAAASPAGNGETAPSLSAYLESLSDEALVFPAVQAARDSVALQEGDSPDLRELAQRWEHEPAIAAHLIGMAGSAMYNTHGRPCRDVAEALTRIGWRTAVSVVAGLALRQSRLQDPRLGQRAQQQIDYSERVAQHVLELARDLRRAPGMCHTAASLHRAGELCVLFCIQRWQDRTSTQASDTQIDDALARHSRAFAERLLMHCGLPLHLRLLIAAVTDIPSGTSDPEHYLMRVAGQLVHGGLTPEQDTRLRRLAGLPDGV